MRLHPAILPVLLATGCFYGTASDPAECKTDEQCAGVCTRTGECVAESNIVDIRISWTVNNTVVSPASDAACRDVNMLSVHFVDFRTDPDVVYRPVPCNLGLITYDKMPGRFDRVELTAWDTSGRELDRASSPIVAGDNNIEMNLQP